MNKTLILSKNYSVDSNNLWSVATELKWNVIRLDRNEVPSNKENLIFYLDTYQGNKIAEKCGYILESPSLNWICDLPFEFVKRNLQAITWKEVKETETYGFYKPLDDKFFKAGIYESARQIKETACSDEISDNELCLWSEVAIFETEYRFFMLNRIPVIGSIYAINGKLAKTDTGYPVNEIEYKEAENFVNSISNDPFINMPDAFVLDVGKLNTGEWAVIEVNPCWASGLYGCDPYKVLKVLEIASIKENT